MVTKIDKSKSTNVKVKQKQNVNVRVNIDQRDTKKKPRKKRSNIPSTKREGVSSFSSGFTPVYIQSGNPYPISPIPPVPEVAPIKVPVSKEVNTLVNPPVTSTSNLIEEIKKKQPVFTEPKKIPKLIIHSIDSRSISPLSFEDLGENSSKSNNSFKSPSIYESIGGNKYGGGRGIMHHYTPSINNDNNSEIFSRDVRPITIRQPRSTRNEMNEAEKMGDNDTLNSRKEKKGKK
jgi:hypothetical protein